MMALPPLYTVPVTQPPTRWTATDITRSRQPAATRLDGFSTMLRFGMVLATQPIMAEMGTMEVATNSTDERALVVNRVTLKQGPVTAQLSLYHSAPDTILMDKLQPTMLYIPGIDGAKDENPFAEQDKGRHINHVTLDRRYVDDQKQIHIASAQGLMDEARLALTWLNQTMKQPVSVAGFSLGGHIAARLASESPSQVRSVHLMSPTFMPGGSHWAFQHVINPLLLRGLSAGNWVRARLGKPLWPSMSAHSLREIRELATPKDHVRIFEGIQAPVHISIGRKEPFSAPYFKTLLNHSPAVGKQLDVIPGEGHAITKPERLDKTLLFHQRYA